MLPLQQAREVRDSIIEYIKATFKFKEKDVSDVHSKMIFLICYLLDYQQVHDNANVSIILLGDKKEPTK